ncbi:hypothetical protein V5799_030876 [Amblyomma americanum]|uniref:DUF4706 domain-containing protein n=1 Tax=Amblyomma americanum TaxID=6943 RepID=A0AAQ4EM36_AMBAM
MASTKLREQVESYFRGLNYASSRIVQDMSTVREAYGEDWDRIPEKKKTEIAWEALVGAEIKEKYNYYPKQYAEVEVFPVIGLNTGDRMVSDEDAANARSGKSGCWRDEHSAPFSWETQSQLNMRIFYSADEVDGTISAENAAVPEQEASGPASHEAASTTSSLRTKVIGNTFAEPNSKVTGGGSTSRTSTFKPCLVSNSASEPNVGKAASVKPETSSNTLEGSSLKHVKFSNGVQSKLPPAAGIKSAAGESRIVIGGSLPRVIHADPKVLPASSSSIESKLPEPRPPPPSRSQESMSSIASRGSSNPPTPVERKGRRRAPTPPKAPPPDPPRPKTAPPKPPTVVGHTQKPPEAPRKQPSTKPPAPPIPKVKSPTQEVASKPVDQEASLAVPPVRPPRLPSPPKDDPKDNDEAPKEAVAVRSPEVGYST